MQLQYNIRKTHATMVSFFLAMLISLAFIQPLFWNLYPRDASQEFAIQSFLATITPWFLIPIIALLLYQNLKKATLIIDNKSIRVSSKILNMFPNFASLSLMENITISKADNYQKKLQGKWVAKFDKRLQNHDTMICVTAKSKRMTQRFIISDSVWHIEDIDEIVQWFTDNGFTVQDKPAKEIAKEIIPANTNLSKRTSYVAYTAIFMILLCFVLPMLDDWSTIYYGAFQYSLFAVLAVSGLLAYWFMQAEPSGNDDLDTNGGYGVTIFVAMFLSVASVLLFLIASLLVMPTIGTKSNITFEYQKLNQYDEEIWQAKENPELKIFCKKADVKQHKPQVAELVTFTSVIRVNGKQLCPDSKFLNDGTLPHK